MWTFKCSLVLACLSLASATNIQSRVVNGQSTTIEQHSYHLSLEYHQEHYCGAVLVRRNVALTGAHCFDNADAWEGKYKEAYRIRASTSYRNQGGKLASVQEVIVHPQWDNLTYNFDVAVVRMCQCLDYSSSFYRVNMVPANAFVPEGTIGTLTGYGRLWYGGDWAPVLQKVDIPVVNQQRCTEVYAGLAAVTDSMFCAGSFTGEFDFCAGDNGGPLVANGMLIGLASWGKGCAEYGYPGVYTRISAVRNWIDAQLD